MSGYGLTHAHCHRCSRRPTLPPARNGCKPVENGSDLHYFRFHWNGKLYAWNPETKTTVYVADDGHVIEKSMDGRGFDDAMTVATNVAYGKVPTSFRAVVAHEWGVTVKKQYVRAI